MGFRSTLLLIAILMLCGPLFQPEQRPDTLAETLACLALFAVSIGFTAAASLWLWQPLIRRFGYYPACAIYVVCLLAALAASIHFHPTLESVIPMYHKTAGRFAIYAFIGSWFCSEHEAPKKDDRHES